MTTAQEILRLANKAVKDGYGDMDFNEYLREYEEAERDWRERIEEEQAQYDSIAEAHGSRWDEW